MWAPALRKAGVRYRKPYQTRHTYASMMLMAGRARYVGCEQMGHTDWSLIVKRYSFVHAGGWTESSKALVTTPLQMIQRKAERGDSFRLPNNEFCKLQIQRCQRFQDCHSCQGALP
jgi:hypothetical protein